jgi:hypothetical protein
MAAGMTVGELAVLHAPCVERAGNRTGPANFAHLASLGGLHPTTRAISDSPRRDATVSD